MKLTPEEIVAAVASEEAFCIDSRQGELQAERTDALDRYQARPLGNEVEGRSQVVDNSVLDTVEWIMPSLCRIFLGGDEIGRFEANGPGDESGAQLETDVCNWYITEKNDFFSHINATLRDALLLKNGYLVGQWKVDESVNTETYEGLAPEEATLLSQDPEVTVVESTENVGVDGTPVFDIKVERKRADEYVAIESVPPDEMLVSRRHRWTSLLDCDFVQWRRRVTIGQLRAEGFEVPDDEPQDDEFSQEWVARSRFGESTPNDYDDNSPDPSRRVVLFKDTYYKIDLRGTGKPQLWRICIINGQDTPILTEEADIIPFAAFSPIIYPHSHVGTSVYDLVKDLSTIQTTLQRQFLDGVYLANSGRVAIDDSRVNLDDLLINRPGGVVRVTGSPQDAMMPLQGVDVTGSVLQGLEYISGVKEQRTGVTRYSQGTDSNTLNKTATGIQNIQSAANQRIELIARTLSSGFRDLFVIVHALALKHSTKPVQIKLDGEWKVINPREWTKRTDFAISVGLGVGTPDAQLGKLQAMAPMMQQAMAMGLAGPMEAYNYGTEIWKAAGYKQADRFIKPPQKDPQTGQVMMPPPQKDPLVQAQEVKSQADMQIKQAELQSKMQAEQARAMADIEVKKAEVAAQAQIDAQKTAYQAQLDQARHDAEQQTKVRIAEIQAAASIEVAKINRGLDDGLANAQESINVAHQGAMQMTGAVAQSAASVVSDLQTLILGLQNSMASHANAMVAHAQAANGPKRIVRDPISGKALGIEPITVQ